MKSLILLLCLSMSFSSFANRDQQIRDYINSFGGDYSPENVAKIKKAAEEHGVSASEIDSAMGVDSGTAQKAFDNFEANKDQHIQDYMKQYDGDYSPENVAKIKNDSEEHGVSAEEIDQAMSVQTGTAQKAFDNFEENKDQHIQDYIKGYNGDFSPENVEKIKVDAARHGISASEIDKALNIAEGTTETVFQDPTIVKEDGSVEIINLFDVNESTTGRSNIQTCSINTAGDLNTHKSFNLLSLQLKSQIGSANDDLAKSCKTAKNSDDASGEAQLAFLRDYYGSLESLSNSLITDLKDKINPVSLASLQELNTSLSNLSKQFNDQYNLMFSSNDINTVVNADDSGASLQSKNGPALTAFNPYHLPIYTIEKSFAANDDGSDQMILNFKSTPNGTQKSYNGSCKMDLILRDPKDNNKVVKTHTDLKPDNDNSISVRTSANYKIQYFLNCESNEEGVAPMQFTGFVGPGRDPFTLSASDNLLSSEDDNRSIASIESKPVSEYYINPNSAFPKNELNSVGCTEGKSCVFVCNYYKNDSGDLSCQNFNPHICLETNKSGAKTIIQDAYSWADGMKKIDLELLENEIYKKEDNSKASKASTVIRLATDENNCRSFRFVDPYIEESSSNMTANDNQYSLKGASEWFKDGDFSHFSLDDVITIWKIRARTNFNTYCTGSNQQYECYDHGN